MFKSQIYFSLPWSSETLIGWFSTFLFGVAGGGSYLFVNGTLITLFLGTATFLKVYHKHFDFLATNFKADIPLIELAQLHTQAKE